MVYLNCTGATDKHPSCYILYWARALWSHRWRRLCENISLQCEFIYAQSRCMYVYYYIHTNTHILLTAFYVRISKKVLRICTHECMWIWMMTDAHLWQMLLRCIFVTKILRNIIIKVHHIWNMCGRLRTVQSTGFLSHVLYAKSFRSSLNPQKEI